MVKLLFFFVLLQLRWFCSQGNLFVTVSFHKQVSRDCVFVYWRICLQRPTVHRRIFSWQCLRSQTNFPYRYLCSQANLSPSFSLFTGVFFYNFDFVHRRFCQKCVLVYRQFFRSGSFVHRHICLV